ncbi:MAG: 6-pyruvoyl-tetrahydropterin synthase-related protein [Lachnospiraceae bacterium]|nr:6-pyruvoyl-tetrahydropterin synthase-related protein [Lachnospiraceae bacterium]
MKTKEISLKHKIVYGIIVLLVTMLLLLNNEGGQPLEYTGSELQHSVGLIDSENSLVIRESVARTGCIANTPQYVMNKGTYTVSMDYKVDCDGSVLELWEQGSKIAAWPVPTGQQKMSVDFTLSKDVKQLQFKTNYSGQGELTIKKFTLAPKGMFYSDTYFFVVLFAVINVVGCLYVRNGRKWLTQEQLVDYSIILGVALLATSPMMQTYLYNGDDLCYHLARLEGLKDGILDGQIPVNILPDGLKNHGYLNAMYPYLFLYIGAFLRICRVSLALSYKVLIFLANLGAAVSAYVAVKSMVQSRRSVILAVVLYTLMPYRFTNIFSRGDLGEILALVFWPFVIAGLYHVILGDRRKWYFLVIGFSGALQSHILSAAFVAVICVITALVYVGRIIRDKRYLEIGKAAGLSMLLNMWYLVPFMTYYYMEDICKDSLRWSSYFEQSINLSNLIQSLSLYNKQYFSLGLALLGCLGIGVIYLLCEHRSQKEDLDGYLLYLLVMGCILAFMTTGYFPNRTLLANSLFENIATMIQFPWRFLGPACACMMFVGVIGLSRSDILKPFRNIIFALLIGLNLLVIVSVPTDNNHMPYDNPEAVASKGHESKLAANIGLFYPHEWRLDGASDERLTSSVISSDMNNITVYDYQKKGTKAVISYSATSDRGYIELPMLSYLGYRAYDENGQKVEIRRGDAARIRLAVTGDGIEHHIYVRYGPVPAFVIANVISALTIAGCIWYRYRYRRKKNASSDSMREEVKDAVVLQQS